jgi:uncharacterized membrane-anchored protein YjiN (DUF445 family)
MIEQRSTTSPARRLAPASLIIAIVLFFATLPFPDIFIVALLHAFSEAAMIGGLADWFAVVALFRHPFGIPIPHTAIIPKHRAKLTTAIIDMVQNRWLTEETILERISGWHVGRSVAAWLSEDGSRETLRRFLRSIIEEVLRSVDPKLIAERASALLRDQVREEDILRWFRIAGEQAMVLRWHDALLNAVLERAGPWLGTTEVRKLVIRNLRAVAEDYADGPLRRIGKWMAESVNALNYDDLADAILRTMSDELQHIRKDADHPARADVDRWLRQLVEGVEEDEGLRAALSRLRSELLEDGRFTDLLIPPIERLRDGALADIESENPVIMRHVSHFLDQMLDKYTSDEKAQDQLDRWTKERIAGLVHRYHNEIGGLVQKNLERLDDDTLVRQIEEKVGGDLQYIRLNGALVGGMVGTLIFLLKHYLF